jgi:hypothetical protein
MDRQQLDHRAQPQRGPTDNALHAAAAVPRSTIVWAAGFRYTPAQLSQTLILKGS